MGDFGYFVVQGVLLVLTAALTPRSTSRTRRIGYAAAAINAVAGATFVLVPATRFMSDYGIWRYYLAAALITAAFCYRDIRTRRAGS